MPTTRRICRPAGLAVWTFIAAVAVAAPAGADDHEPAFPVAAEVLADEPLESCEGIAFNGEGRLFATCNRAFLEIGRDGSVREIVALDSNLGVAAIGERDLLVADFGPTNAFRHDRNDDGVVYRISPDGDKRADSTGFGDPNFVLVLEDGSYLVSDDATADIYHVDTERNTTLFSTAVSHPNGLALSPDGSTLYVAQIFSNIRPVVFDNAIWAMPLVDGKPARAARVVARTSPNGGVDGLAMDAQGRVYVAANIEGKVWRYDPAIDETLLIAEDVWGIASLVFGEGEFDRESLYGAQTNSQGRGGKIVRIPVGTTSGPIYR